MEVPSIVLVMSLGHLIGSLDALQHEVNDGKEDISIRVGSFKPKAQNEHTFLIGRLGDNGTGDLTSIKLTNYLMSRSPATEQ